MAYKDLRDYLDTLEREGEILRITREVDPVFEVAAVIRRAGDKAVYCERVKGFSMPMVGSLFGSPRKVELALQLERGNLVKEYWRRSRSPIDPVMVSSGPVQERVFTGEQVDLGMLPVPLTHEFDGGHIIDSGMIFTRDPELGYNVSINRLHIKGPRKTGLNCGKAGHLWHYLSRSWKRSKPLEVAVVIGADPAMYVASQTRMGLGMSELQVAGGLRQEPVRLVPCKTVDLAVPADAEIVLEGFVPLDVREPEGPYGEYPGYYGASEASPVIHYTAITTRRDPIYQMILIGKPPTENNFLTAMPKASSIYQILRESVNDVRDVYLTPGGAGTFHCVVSIKKSFDVEARRGILAVLASRVGVRQVIVVDEDIDIRNPVEVEWAVATRSEFHKDTIIADELYAGLNPAPPGKANQKFTTGIGIDATLPLEREYARVCDVHQETLKRVDAEWESYLRAPEAPERRRAAKAS